MVACRILPFGGRGYETGSDRWQMGLTGKDENPRPGHIVPGYLPPPPYFERTPFCSSHFSIIFSCPFSQPRNFLSDRVRLDPSFSFSLNPKVQNACQRERDCEALHIIENILSAGELVRPQSPHKKEFPLEKKSRGSTPPGTGDQLLGF